MNFLRVMIICLCLPVMLQGRDPFFLPKQSEKHESGALKLTGIIGDKSRRGAIVTIGERSKIVFPGDVVKNYFVTKITDDKVFLQQGKKSMALALVMGAY